MYSDYFIYHSTIYHKHIRLSREGVIIVVSIINSDTGWRRKVMMVTRGRLVSSDLTAQARLIMTQIDEFTTMMGFKKQASFNTIMT